MPEGKFKAKKVRNATKNGGSFECMTEAQLLGIFRNFLVENQIVGQ